MPNLNVCDLGLMPYGEALDIQRRLLVARQENRIGDTLLIVEHPRVLTLGRTGNQANIYWSKEQLHAAGVEVFEVERGGDVTYHGPGQIVGYPIIKLDAFPGGIRGYIAALATAITQVLQNDFRIAAEQRYDKYTGVWVGESKIVAIGVAVKRAVSMHGFAFNVNTDLEPFSWINPCGLSKGVTSVQQELGHAVDFEQVKQHVVKNIAHQFQMEPVAMTLNQLISDI